MSASGPKKKGGGFLSRQAKTKDKTAPIEPITEEELLRKDVISPDEVLRFQQISHGNKHIFYSPIYEMFQTSSKYVQVRFDLESSTSSSLFTL